MLRDSKKSFITHLRTFRTMSDWSLVAESTGLIVGKWRLLSVRDKLRSIHTARTINRITQCKSLRASYAYYRSDCCCKDKAKIEACFDFLIKDLRVFNP